MDLESPRFFGHLHQCMMGLVTSANVPRNFTAVHTEYALAPALALPFETAELDLPVGYSGRVLWCEVGADQADSALSPAAWSRVQRWREHGTNVDAEVVSGLPFWQILRYPPPREAGSAWTFPRRITRSRHHKRFATSSWPLGCLVELTRSSQLAGLRGFDLRCGDLARASVRKRLMGLNARSRQVPEVVVVQTLVLAGG